PQRLPQPPQPVLATAPIPHPEQVEVEPDESEGIDARVLEASLESEEGQGLAALLPCPPREVADDGHAGKDQNEDHRPHHWQYDQASPGGDRSGPPRRRSTRHAR